MNVLVFGAAGMVGQAVLRECLLDAGVAVVTAVGRTMPNLIIGPQFARGRTHRQACQLARLERATESHARREEIFTFPAATTQSESEALSRPFFLSRHERCLR